MSTQDLNNNNGFKTAGFRLAQSGRFPLSVSLGRSETKTRGSIIAESGRSMVEMLGTLAIVGVLSIGGIAGYSYGMDKYRANETINDVNMRGIDLVRQVAMGQTTLSLSDWPTVSKAGYTISEPTLSAEGDAYFTISGVPKRVCELVYDGVMQNQTTDVEINGYVVDDSSTCGNDNTMGFFFITNAGAGGTNPEELCNDIGCPEGYSCTHGICLIQDKPEYVNGSGRIMCEKQLDCGLDECVQCNDGGNVGCAPVEDGISCENGTKVCHGGSCVDKTKQCNNNGECGPNEFCGDTNEDGCNPHPYRCKKLNYREVALPKGTLYISNLTMSYWDAKNACEALNARFLTDAEAQSFSMFASLWFWIETEEGCYATFFQINDGWYSRGLWDKNAPHPYGTNISMVCIKGELSEEDTNTSNYFITTGG